MITGVLALGFILCVFIVFATVVLRGGSAIIDNVEKQINDNQRKH